MVNFNNDAYSDFILFNPNRKEVLAVTGSINGEIIERKKFFLPFEVSSFLPLNNESSTPYVFTSRKNRMAGLYELNNNGKPNSLKTADFNSYPEFINTADVDADGKNEIIISGGAFNGISLLYQEGNKLVEKNIIGGAYYKAAFIDLNNDGYPDIAGYDLMNRSFSYFYNNSQGEFRKVRSIPVPEKPAGIKTFDLNLDSYEDLIFSAGYSINIWYGDFRSSYENTKRIETNYKPDKYIYGDFNKDGLIDLAYLNVEHSLISIFFAKNEFDYYPEIIYLKQSGLRDIIPYYSRFIDGIAALSNEGELHTITNLSSFTEDVNISIGAKPNAISFFDNENNGITDFCFIDEYDKKIKFIVRDNTGIPASYFSQQLFEDHDKIISENHKAGEKNYICFSYNKKLIEVVKADFSNKKISKTVLYSPGAIWDLKVRRENNDEYKIFILYKNGESLNFGVFSYRDLKFSFSNQLIDNIKVFDASLGLNNININYWAEKKDKLSLLKREPGRVSELAEEKISLLKYDIKNIISFTGDLLSMDKDVVFSFINEDERNYAVISTDTFSTVISKKKKSGEFRITSKNNLFFGETRFNGLKKLSVYLPEKNIINRLEFIQKGKNIASTKLADTSQLGSFFIKNMTLKYYHLVYSNIEKGCITIKRLKG
ncbi:MAG: VCBS repeat-containing protein [Ignavibacteria bacterium]|nr:VCBS repeat-containing protein [Ignavibacteria bacterium]